MLRSYRHQTVDPRSGVIHRSGRGDESFLAFTVVDEATSPFWLSEAAGLVASSTTARHLLFRTSLAILCRLVLLLQRGGLLDNPG